MEEAIMINIFNDNQKNDIDNNAIIAREFKNKLDSLLKSKPPISKDKMDQLLKEALKSIRNYKHVVYYVERFIKNCPQQYKISGLYIIDAIIRTSHVNKKGKSSCSRFIKKSRDLYLKRFSKNMCKTFSNLFNKCSQSDRDKITKILQLWKKYNIIEIDLLDKLNRIAEATKLETAINGTESADDEHKHYVKNDTKVLRVTETESHMIKKLNYLEEKLSKHLKNDISSKTQKNTKGEDIISNKIINEINILSSKLKKNDIFKINKPDNKTEISGKNKSHITTRTEISNLLKHDEYNNLICNSDNRVLENSKKSITTNELTAETVLFNKSSSDRFKAVLTNCADWVQSNIPLKANGNLIKDKNEDNNVLHNQFSLPDLSQPPPPLLTNYIMLAAAAPPPPPPSSPPRSLVPQVNVELNSIITPKPVMAPSFCLSNISNDQQYSKASIEIEKGIYEKQVNYGLSNLKVQHVCIYSKTLWLGHLSKLTSEENLIDNLIEFFNLFENNNKKHKSSTIINRRNLITEVNLIPPRGCAYVEFVNRKQAAKCLERMKDGNYKLDGQFIKVAWATNKGINKDKRIKQYWNVEKGCTYVPWFELNDISPIDFGKLADGGIIDESSVPNMYKELFENQAKFLNENKKNNDDIDSKKSNNPDSSNDHSKTLLQQDMEIDENEDYRLHPQSIQLTQPQLIQAQFPHPPNSVSTPLHGMNFFNSQPLNLLSNIHNNNNYLPISSTVSSHFNQELSLTQHKVESSLNENKIDQEISHSNFKNVEINQNLTNENKNSSILPSIFDSLGLSTHQVSHINQGHMQLSTELLNNAFNENFRQDQNSFNNIAQHFPLLSRPLFLCNNVGSRQETHVPAIRPLNLFQTFPLLNNTNDINKSIKTEINNHQPLINIDRLINNETTASTSNHLAINPQYQHIVNPYHQFFNLNNHFMNLSNSSFQINLENQNQKDDNYNLSQDINEFNNKKEKINSTESNNLLPKPLMDMNFQQTNNELRSSINTNSSNKKFKEDIKLSNEYNIINNFNYDNLNSTIKYNYPRVNANKNKHEFSKYASSHSQIDKINLKKS